MTARVATGIGVALAALLAPVVASVGWAEMPAHFNAKTMMPVSEVKPGMKGVGKTVFKGVEISDFPVEVVGVVPKFNLGGDLVLIRVMSGPLCERECGVVGGMSGSPVYIDGRLVGAVAYTWPFEKEPIGGVTPIESMLDGYVEEKPKAPEKTAALPAPPTVLHGRTLTAARIAPLGETEPFADASTINLVPVGLMSCSGASRRVLADFAEFMAPYGLEPVAGPGGMATPVKADLVPGAGVSVELQRGDFSVSLIGTVTYREGDRVLCFGHPMMQLGAVDVPLATAYIHDFIPSYNRTDKVGSSMEMVGSLKRDGAWSVGGLVGPVSKMVPVDVSVADETTGRRRDFHVEVAHEKTLTQALVAMSLGDAIEAGFRPGGEGTAHVRYQVEGERGAKVTRENIFWDNSSIASACTREIVSSIYVLRRNPFEPQEPSRVRAEVSLSDATSAAAIEEVYTDQSVAKAGEKLTVHTVLRPWSGKPFEKVVELKLPDDLARGTMRLGICGGEVAYTMRSRLGLLQPDFHDLPSIIADMEKTELNNQLFVGAALPNSAVGVAQYLLHRLPSSISAIMQDSHTTDISTGKEEVSTLLNCDQVVVGQEMLMIPTEDKTGARAATTTPSSTPETPSGGGGKKPAPKAPSDEGEGRVNPLTAPPLPWAQALLARAWPTETKDAPKPPRDAGPTKPPAAKDEPSAKDSGAKDKDKEKPEPPPAPSEEEKPAGQALIRELSEWRQSSESDFKEGKSDGVAIRSDGSLYLGLKEVRSGRTEERRSVWSVAADAEGRIYVGTGKDGRVYRFVEGSAPELVCQTGELAVHALALSGGQLYVGTIPQGKLFKVDPGKPNSMALATRLPEDYIWCLLPDGSGGVYAGTGSEGRVYHVTAKGEVAPLADLPAQHVLCLAQLGDDLLAGTSESGVVYRIKPDGRFEAVYDDESPAVTGIAVTSGGEVYACTGDKGHVVRITPGKQPRTVLKLEDAAATAMVAIGDTAYVATDDDGKLVAVLSPDVTAVTAQVRAAADVSCLAASGTRLVAGSANPGNVALFDTGDHAEGTFTSAVLDAERVARWGALLWTGDVPEGSSAEVRLRVGATVNPDDGTWGPWSFAYPPLVPSQVVAAPARYLQYCVSLKKSDGKPSPILRSLVLKYLPANQPPTLKLTAPLDGAAISGKFALKWDASDPDDDDLRYAVYARREGSPDWKLLADQLEEKKYEWDTTKKVDEGIVALRVVASDALSEPAEPLTKEAISYPVTIDNTPPSVWPTGDPEVRDTRSVVIRGEATDGSSAIVSVEYRIGSKGKWMTARPSDGLFDSRDESFEVRTAPLDPGEVVVTIRAWDAAGNKKDKNVTVVIPREKKETAVAAAPRQDGAQDAHGDSPKNGR